jgi:DNA (cytosine-5)-methyltransferase 1
MVAIAQRELAAAEAPRHSLGLSVAGLFAGIGGIELGLHRAGHRTRMFCEIDPNAAAVLDARFAGVDRTADVREIEGLPPVDLVTAGFPCTDLSQAGRTAGIGGRHSGLVDHVFRLLERGPGPTWLLLENVPFLLHLDRGRGMTHLVDRLEALGYAWAYRIVDTRAFGLPQRRRRVLFLASRTEDPRPVLFGEDAGPRDWGVAAGRANGFYWTEGLAGLGWAVDAVPTLKGGSTIGIPSPPAIWLPTGHVILPDIADAERLQGFPAGWTDVDPEARNRRNGPRWKLVGNAVSVPVAEWLGQRLSAPDDVTTSWSSERLLGGHKWPEAAWGDGTGARHRALVSEYPVHVPYQHLAGFLEHEGRPLSARGARGFLSRASRSTLRFPDGLLDAVRAHADADPSSEVVIQQR